MVTGRFLVVMLVIEFYHLMRVSGLVVVVMVLFFLSVALLEEGMSVPSDLSVESVVVVGGVVYFPNGSVSFFKFIVALYLISVPGLFLALKVMCVRVMDAVLKLIVWVLVLKGKNIYFCFIGFIYENELMIVDLRMIPRVLPGRQIPIGERRLLFQKRSLSANRNKRYISDISPQFFKIINFII